jgi:hypothetical protein
MKAHGGLDVQIHIVLTSALVGGEWSASRPSQVILIYSVPEKIVQDCDFPGYEIVYYSGLL